MHYLLEFFVIILLFFITFLYLKGKYKQFLINKKIRQQLKRGFEKENLAKKFLENHGYKIMSHNEEFSYYLTENSEKKKITIETDYIVYKNNKKYIVEVKSGIDSPKITNRNTRRQILEYYMFIKNDGVLLLNMETEQISEIIFPINKTSKTSNIIIFIAIVEFLAILTLIFFSFFR